MIATVKMSPHDIVELGQGTPGQGATHLVQPRSMVVLFAVADSTAGGHVIAPTAQRAPQWSP